jgi:hypothetical protein
MIDTGEVELHAGRGRTRQLAYPLPGLEALPEPKLAREPERRDPARTLDTLHSVSRPAGFGHAARILPCSARQVNDATGDHDDDRFARDRDPCGRRAGWSFEREPIVDLGESRAYGTRLDRVQ